LVDLAHSSHLKLHLKVIVPVYLSSTTVVGLQSSSVLTLLVALGADAVIRSDSARGSDDTAVGKLWCNGEKECDIPYTSI
jgi:hypothetical protein